ncbi:caspase family protein [Nocardia niwae]|uniref:caspase family protein n=1 Tax=Nocardia niwae TaxID=626084 RepID=UPI0007A45624|nr:caspase family protein [Nocardia niwae]
MAKRSLIIANQHYRDPAFAELPGAAHDATELESVLADPKIGGFEVEVLRDATAAECRMAIERFFRDAHGDDLLLLHMSCHGQKDLQNCLFMIGTDSMKAYIASTGIDSAFINDQIESSRSNKTVLLLDCCYSGAYFHRRRPRSAPDSVDVTEPFFGQGRVVITASTSLQFSHESEASSRVTNEPSVFTSAVVHGLRTGAADLNGDGLISIDELYTYVHDSVKRRTPHQTPTRSVSRVQGPLFIAKNVAGRPSDETTPIAPPEPEPEPGWKSLWSPSNIGMALLVAGVTATYLLWPDSGPEPVERTLEIAEPGDTAELTFEGRAGQKVFVDVTSSTFPSQCGLPVLRDPTGNQIANGCTSSNGTGYIDGTALRADGRYTVLLDPANNATGKATARVIDVTDQDAEIALDGSPITAAIEAPGAVSKLRFTAAAGQKVFVKVSSSTLPALCGVLELRDPSDKEIANGCTYNDGTGYIDTARLTSPGEYTIVVDPDANATGKAQVQLFNVVDQEKRITPNGPHVTSSIEQPGAVSKLRFTGTAGQRVSVVVDSSTLPAQCGVLELRDRAGKELDSECIDQNGAGFIKNTILPAAGEYTIVVDPGDYATGTSQVRLFDVVDQDTTIAPDGPPVTSSIEQPGAISKLRFTGTAGQQVSIVVSTSTLPAECGVLKLWDRAGKELYSECIEKDGTGRITTTLPNADEYTITVDPSGTVTGDSQVRLYTG